MNFRNSDCGTVHVVYVESVDSAVFGIIKSLSVYRSTSMLTGKFLHEHFVPPPEVASLSQQGRIAATQRACEVFSIE